MLFCRCLCWDINLLGDSNGEAIGENVLDATELGALSSGGDWVDDSLDFLFLFGRKMEKEALTVGTAEAVSDDSWSAGSGVCDLLGNIICGLDWGYDSQEESEWGIHG